VLRLVVDKPLAGWRQTEGNQIGHLPFAASRLGNGTRSRHMVPFRSLRQRHSLAFLASVTRSAPIRISWHHRPTGHLSASLPSLPFIRLTTTQTLVAAMGPIERLTDELEAPLLDDRSYRVIRLPNKLEALLVHDPETDKASASVNVKVGSFSDADDMPGMAHAVEHLLFMGTRKVICFDLQDCHC